MTTNAARIAQRAADREYRRGLIIHKAVECLRESAESIKANASGNEAATLIAESVEQAKAYVTKHLGKLDADARDDADDNDERNRNLGRLEREGEDEDDGDDEHPDKKLSRLADFVSQSHRTTRDGALRWLTTTRQGREFQRTHKGDTMQKDSLQTIVKDHGIVAFAKMVADDGDAHGLDEETFTRLATEHAVKLYPDKRPDAAFAKLFSDQSPDGVALRKAHTVIKDQMVITPVFVGGADARAVDNPKSALDELDALVSEQRARAPWLSISQAWAKVYEDPANRELTKRERAEARARMGDHPSYPR
jgi:hypothetical protein